MPGGNVQPVSVAEGSSFSGTVATFSDGTNNASTASDYGAVINWGDGQTTAGAISSRAASSW